jgi:membrane protease YdiL (CAAX protease family)
MVLQPAVDELARLRREVPPVSLREAAAASALVVAYGNAVVIVGRQFDEPLLATTIGVPLLGAVGIGWLRRRGTSWHDLGFRFPHEGVSSRARWILRCAATLAAGGVIARLVLGDAENRVDLLRLLIGTALGEEIVHRSVVLALWCGTRLPARLVVAANAIVFGLWHVAGAVKPGGFQPIDVVLSTAGTLLFLWSRLHFRSVVAPALLHTSTNILDFE